ncbi:hypothetical protein QOL99_00270 [Deinococcus sp. MIMF12]|uniref:Uncharacterized protein n=1 Tax=Deinococcus rhizophilus TaxID=3049544 RepID=A0ABT7JC16_9DEIO|nr:hypothetical protein [Deinococcus rhizophilus]MDL2342583.1 hypothetical protein [Deinococcus rhizophilus]
MTHTAERPQEIRPVPSGLPHLYRLLAVFSGIPKPPALAVKDAGLWTQDEHAPLTDHHRALLRRLAEDGRVQWVTWGPDGPGYVLTGYGEIALESYRQRYGPAYAPRRGPSLGEIAARNRQRDRLVVLLEQRKATR